MSSIEQAFDARPLRPLRHDRIRRAHPAAPAVRLTRRGRLLLHGGTALLLTMGALTGVLGFGTAALAGDQIRPVPVTYHDVLPGETLWAIAEATEPQVDPRETIARIVDLNALDDQALSAGQRLALPAG